MICRDCNGAGKAHKLVDAEKGLLEYMGGGDCPTCKGTGEVPDPVASSTEGEYEYDPHTAIVTLKAQEKWVEQAREMVKGMPYDDREAQEDHEQRDFGKEVKDSRHPTCDYEGTELEDTIDFEIVDDMLDEIDRLRAENKSLNIQLGFHEKGMWAREDEITTLKARVKELEKERDDYKEISEKDHLKCIELGLKAENLEKRMDELRDMFNTVVTLNQRYEAEFIKARHLALEGYWCPNCSTNMKDMASKHFCEDCKERVSVPDEVCSGFLDEMDWWEKTYTPKEGEECQK